MKIFLSKINESWIVDRVRSDWYKHNLDISTEDIKSANIVWIISPWMWKKIPKRHLKKKNIVCSVYHIDFENFDKKEKDDFYERDKYVDFYHVISLKTKQQLEKLTKKKIISIPFWVNQDIWFPIENKQGLRSNFNLNKEDYLVGSFQRDTEGSDMVSPKLIKGPDIFLEIVEKIYDTNKNLKVILSGKRRNYLIENFQRKRNVHLKILLSGTLFLITIILTFSVIKKGSGPLGFLLLTILFLALSILANFQYREKKWM